MEASNTGGISADRDQRWWRREQGGWIWLQISVECTAGQCLEVPKNIECMDSDITWMGRALEDQVGAEREGQRVK
jgi:hypothetical protein